MTVNIPDDKKPAADRPDPDSLTGTSIVILNTKTREMHTTNCSRMEKIHEPNRERVELSEAIGRGFDFCGYCFRSKK